jgi:alkanesulfonate monooxygenase
VARYATEYNTPFMPADAAATQYRLVSEACEAAGRDPAGVTRSAAIVVCCGVDDAEVARRAAAIGRSVDDLTENGACGTPEQVAARLGEYAAAGSTRIYLQVLDLSDLDHLRLIAEQVAPLLS